MQRKQQSGSNTQHSQAESENKEQSEEQINDINMESERSIYSESDDDTEVMTDHEEEIGDKNIQPDISSLIGICNREFLSGTFYESKLDILNQN